VAEIIQLKDVRIGWNADLDVAYTRENAAMAALIGAWFKRNSFHVRDQQEPSRVYERYQKCAEDFIEAHTESGKVANKVACEMIDGKRMKRSK
jgi:hypothetical protein